MRWVHVLYQVRHNCSFCQTLECLWTLLMPVSPAELSSTRHSCVSASWVLWRWPEPHLPQTPILWANYECCWVLVLLNLPLFLSTPLPPFLEKLGPFYQWVRRSSENNFSSFWGFDVFKMCYRQYLFTNILQITKLFRSDFVSNKYCPFNWLRGGSFSFLYFSW